SACGPRKCWRYWAPPPTPPRTAGSGTTALPGSACPAARWWTGTARRSSPWACRRCIRARRARNIRTRARAGPWIRRPGAAAEPAAAACRPAATACRPRRAGTRAIGLANTGRAGWRVAARCRRAASGRDFVFGQRTSFGLGLEHAATDLAGAGLGQGVAELDRARHHELLQVRAAVGEDGAGVEALVVAHHDRLERVPHHRVGHPHQRRLAYAGQRVEHVLHFLGA